MRTTDRENGRSAQTQRPSSPSENSAPKPPQRAEFATESAVVAPVPPRVPTGANAAPQPIAPANKGRVSVIGSDLAILGADLRIVSRGTVQIEGVVQGDVLGTEVIIGDEGSVTGLVNAERVEIFGTVLGTIRAREVRLAASARVEGDIHHQVLSLDHGAEFEGSARRPQDVASLLPDLDGARAPTPGPSKGSPVSRGATTGAGANWPATASVLRPVAVQGAGSAV